MSEITYQELSGLIAHQEVKGSRVEVTFRCPKTGVSQTSTAGIQRGRDLGNLAVSGVKQELWRSLRNGIMRAISSLLGGGMMGRVGRQVGNEVVRNAGQGARHTGADVENAVVAAFVRVQNQFRREGSGWVAAHGQVTQEEVDTGFHAQLRGAPIQERYDQGVLARVMVEIAKGDGALSGEEQNMVAAFVDPSLGTIDQLATRPPLSNVELSETTPAARDTILMLGWALALSDSSLAPNEAARLESLAAGLGIAAERAAALKGYSQAFLVDQALDVAYRSGARDAAAHQHAMQIAAAIGLDAESAERADVRYRKARGIV
jgi:tellurite resistance protein